MFAALCTFLKTEIPAPGPAVVTIVTVACTLLHMQGKLYDPNEISRKLIFVEFVWIPQNKTAACIK